jgi:hydroxyacylglutathione hydrolase
MLPTVPYQIHAFTFNAFGENTYVVSHSNQTCLLIDPGNYEPEEHFELQNWLENNELRPLAIVNTHAHIDHVLGIHWCSQKYKIPIYMPTNEVTVWNAATVMAPSFGFHKYQHALQIDHWIDGDTLEIDAFTFQVLNVPGHSPGHLAFYFKEIQSLISGDVLFKGSIGRTDLPGGNFKTLEKSIRNQLYSLPDTTIVYPGHGPATQIAYEKQFNPYVPF